VDAVWAVEPWASKLELEAQGRVFLEDRDTNVTLLAARAAFLRAQAELARKLVSAHKELTGWIQQHPAETLGLVKDELKALTSSAPDNAVIERALARTLLTNDISRASLDRMVASAQKVGFLKTIPDLTDLLPKM
jgi:NitT/TauT family transport system substrate-binding protein